VVAYDNLACGDFSKGSGLGCSVLSIKLIVEHGCDRTRQQPSGKADAAADNFEGRSDVVVKFDS